MLHLSLALSQKKEIAYIEQVLKLKIHHKLDIVQFRNKMYEKPKVGATAAHASLPCYMVATFLCLSRVSPICRSHRCLIHRLCS